GREEDALDVLPGGLVEAASEGRNRRRVPAQRAARERPLARHDQQRHGGRRLRGCRRERDIGIPEAVTLRMTFIPGGKNVDDEVAIDPPYDFLVAFISTDIGHTASIAHALIEQVRDALAGQAVSSSGNAWALDADASTATLSN